MFIGAIARFVHPHLIQGLREVHRMEVGDGITESQADDCARKEGWTITAAGKCYAPGHEIERSAMDV